MKAMKERRRENSLNVSLSKDDADIFDEGIQFPRCAGILHNCLQNLEKKINQIFELSFSMREAQIKGVRYIKEADKSISSLMRN